MGHQAPARNAVDVTFAGHILGWMKNTFCEATDGHRRTALEFELTRMRRRNKEVITEVQLDFRGVPSILPRKCYFSPSRMKADNLLPSNLMYGVTATTNIAKGDLVVADHFVFAGRDVQDFRPKSKVCNHCLADIKTWTARCCPDCMTIHCNEICAKWASTYHSALCGLDFSWLDDWARNKGSHDPYTNQVVLLVRLLAYASQTIDTAPLDNVYLSRFTAGYRANPTTLPLSFTAMVVHPTRILGSLGIDIFQDHQYDTWVIQVLMDRIIMNYGCHTQVGKGSPFFLGGLYSMFNHSCEPNLIDGPEHANRRAVPTLFARRDIEEGEELTVSYIALGLPYQQRNQSLITWFDPCLCEICEEDRRWTGATTGRPAMTTAISSP